MSAPEPGAATSAEKAVEPFVTVVKGSPSDEELAALVLVLNAARGGPVPGNKPRDQWGSPTERLRVDRGMPSSYPNRG